MKFHSLTGRSLIRAHYSTKAEQACLLCPLKNTHTAVFGRDMFFAASFRSAGLINE